MPDAGTETDLGKEEPRKLAADGEHADRMESHSRHPPTGPLVSGNGAVFHHLSDPSAPPLGRIVPKENDGNAWGSRHSESEEVTPRSGASG
ncbi:hypothetical protein SKAU_G00160170 [Synaphobranchus kaupii]|uniref:Uncharacterized protein n=1 Tax=Synaphobranchus kaupii TaxID=118154 RepID=A0A9Q1IZT2_SYNKA|nr:hypothetical protein SKAU_G00160170 [Synaphobranchus kaupii]